MKLHLATERGRLVRLVVTLSVLVVICIGWRVVGRPAPEPVTPPGVGPPDLVHWRPGPDVGLTDRTGEFRCIVQRGTASRLLYLGWHHTPTGEHFLQQVPLSYWPTAICRGEGDLTLCVGGQRANGDACVEVRELARPVLTEELDARTGRPAWRVSYPPPRSIDTVYDERLPGMEVPTAMQLLQGGRAYVVVKFADSMELHRISIDPRRPGHTLLAAPSGSGSGTVLIVPELRADTPSLRSMNHSVLGYVTYASTVSGDGTALVLSDPDRDLEYEDCLVVRDVHDWNDSGMNDRTLLLPPD
jgi:hypothetical protein